MTDQYPHLGALAIEWIDLSPEERIAKIRSERFTEYPRSRFILDCMHQQFHQPRGLAKPNILVWGESGQGKTYIRKKYVREHPSSFDETSGVTMSPVASIEMPPMCDVRWFYTLLLKAINAPVGPTRTGMPEISERVDQLYRTVNVKQILIDDANNMLMGTIRQQRVMLTTIRYLSNTLEIPLVLFGIQDAREALLHDKQLARRFRMLELPAWKAGQDFHAIVGSILRSLPLRRPSVLTARSLKTLLVMTGGVTASIFEVLNNLGIEAIQSAEERITPELISEYESIHLLASG